MYLKDIIRGIHIMKTDSAQIQYDKMTKTPVNKLVLQLGLPTTVNDGQVVEAGAYCKGGERVICRIIGDGPGRCGKCQEKRRGRNQFFHDYAPSSCFIIPLY